MCALPGRTAGSGVPSRRLPSRRSWCGGRRIRFRRRRSWYGVPLAVGLTCRMNWDLDELLATLDVNRAGAPGDYEGAATPGRSRGHEMSSPGTDLVDSALRGRPVT